MRNSDVEKHVLNGGASLPDISELPARVSRERAAELVTRFYFEIKPRSMERCPIRWQVLNGKAHCSVAELFGWAQTVLDASPPVMGGRRAAQEHHTL
jgi:hypothetical protein